VALEAVTKLGELEDFLGTEDPDREGSAAV
jgi:hypothetical protein